MPLTSKTYINELCSALELASNLNSEQRHRLKHLLDYLTLLMGEDRDAIKTWLQTANPSLNGRVPIECLSNEKDCEAVLKLLRYYLEQDSRIG